MRHKIGYIQDGIKCAFEFPSFLAHSNLPPANGNIGSIPARHAIGRQRSTSLAEGSSEMVFGRTSSFREEMMTSGSMDCDMCGCAGEETSKKGNQLVVHRLLSHLGTSFHRYLQCPPLSPLISQATFRLSLCYLTPIHHQCLRFRIQSVWMLVEPPSILLVVTRLT